jgi:glycosyltransferase involved in cell wall biosynthesis
MAEAPLLLHVFSTFAPGGPQVRTVQLIEALGAEFRHAVLPLDGDARAASLLGGRASVRLLDPPPRAGTLRSAARLRRVLQREAPALVLTYNWGAIDMVLAARSLGGVPSIHHEDGFRSDEAAGFKRRRVWMRRAALGGCARVIVPSLVLERIAHELWGLAPERVRMIPNGVRLADYEVRWSGRALRELCGFPTGSIVIGSAAHLRPEKNLARLLRACALLAHLEPLRVLIVGDGPERAPLEALARSLGIAHRVAFAGHQAKLAPWYQAMDVFALSSDTEQMPVGLLEAMASSLPCAATAVGDLRAMLPIEQAALLVPLGGEERAVETALAHSIEQLARDEALRARLGALNRARAEAAYGFETMLGAHRAEWLAAIGSRA